MNTGTLLVVGCIVLLAMGLESITGFGATILALPFLSIFIDIQSAVVLMSMLSALFGIYIFCRHRRYIATSVLFPILLFGGLGLPLGMLAFSVLPERVLKIVLGLFVTASALRALLSPKRRATASSDPQKQDPMFSGWPGKAILLAGGVFHGAFACGGPLFTLYVSGRIQAKQVFRATLTTTWAVFGILIFMKNICFGGIINQPFMSMWLLCVPFLAAGAAVGARLYHKVSVRTFSRLTNILLLVAGVSTLLSQR